MKQWQKIKIAERDLGDLLDELSPVVTVGASKMHALGAKCRHVGWVADWVLAGVLAELDAGFEPVPYDQIAYRNTGIYRMPVVLASESNFEYVPQRRPYVRWHGEYRGMGY